jgi:hypothetical protein
MIRREGEEVGGKEFEQSTDHRAHSPVVANVPLEIF